MEIVPRLLRELQPHFPTTKFELSVSNGTEDLLSRQADIAIRTMPTVQQAILAKKVGEI